MIRSTDRRRGVPLHCVVLLVSCGLVACSEPLACTSELLVTIAPRETTLRVAEAVEPTLRLASCGGRETLAARFSLSSSDTAVVRIEPGSRRARAVGPGSAQVFVTDSTYGSVGAVLVTVTGAP